METSPAEIQRVIREAQEATEIQKAVNTIFKALNHGNDDQVADAVFKAVAGEHRTLQQNFFRMLQQFMVRYGNEAGCDLRNEASVAWARQMAQEMQGLPYI